MYQLFQVAAILKKDFDMVGQKHYENAEKLAPSIVEQWQQGNRSGARAIAERKLAEFDKAGYKSSTVKSLVSVYRDAIRRNLRKRGYVQRDSRIIHIKPHLAKDEPLTNYSYKLEPLKLFGGSYRAFDGSVKQSNARKHIDQFNDDQRDRVDAKNWDRVPVTHETLQKLYQVAESDLSKLLDPTVTLKMQDVYNAVLALVLVTGRRPYREMMIDANFFARSEDNRLDFIGQSKGDSDKREQVYQVNVVGVTPTLVLDAFKVVRERLSDSRALQKFHQVYRDTENESRAFQQLRNSTKAQMSSATYRYSEAFQDQRSNGWSKVLGELHPHDFRALYGHGLKLEYETKIGRSVDEDQFLAKVLFHETKRSTGETKADSMTAKSYKRFQVVDVVESYTSLETGDIVL